MYIKISIFIFVFALLACGEQNPHKVDVSDIDVEIELDRYEKKFFEIEEGNFDSEFYDLYQDHPEMTEVLVEQILGFGRMDDKTGSYLLPLKNRFYNDPYLKELNQDIQEQYTPNKIREIEEGLSQAFRYISYHFPDATLPDFSTTLTSFTYNTVSYKNLIAISLDMYLGKDYRYYPSLGFPVYKMRRMSNEYIVPDVLTTYFLDKFEEREYAGNDLLSNMIYEGKVLYFLDATLPEAHDTLKIQYTKEQLEWCRAFEGRVWNHFVSQDLLFTSDAKEIDRFLEDGPFTSASGLPHESAPRLGAWVGWQIVRHYMDQYPETTLYDLIQIKDAEKILNRSRYNPR